MERIYQIDAQSEVIHLQSLVVTSLPLSCLSRSFLSGREYPDLKTPLYHFSKKYTCSSRADQIFQRRGMQNDGIRLQE